MKKMTSFRLTPELKEEIEKLSKLEKLTKTAVIEKCLDHYILSKYTAVSK